MTRSKDLRPARSLASWNLFQTHSKKTAGAQCDIYACAAAGARLPLARGQRLSGWRQSGFRKPTFHPEMVVEEHGVAGASPCECRSTFLETHARLQVGLGEGGAGGAGENWGNPCCSSVAWSPFPWEPEAPSHFSLPLFWPWLLHLFRRY